MSQIALLKTINSIHTAEMALLVAKLESLAYEPP
jgi:hypothetical protein